MHDQMVSGDKFRGTHIVDDVTRECLRSAQAIAPTALMSEKTAGPQNQSGKNKGITLAQVNLILLPRLSTVGSTPPVAL